jgi:hypothetical protein
MDSEKTNNLLRLINEEVEDFKTKNISIVAGLYFNQYDMVHQIHFAINSKFQSGDIDDEGDKKFYRNISINPCKVTSKAIDFDTKNIRLLTTGGGDPMKTWYMERDLKFWMREKQFGKTLNRIFTELPQFGSVVLKIVNGTPYFVDLRNFVIEQSADTLEDSNYLVEIHNYTPVTFRKVGKEMGWDPAKVDEAIEKFRQSKGASHIRLLERYGEVEETDSKGKKTYSYKRVYIADVGEDEYDQRGELTVAKAGVTMESKVVDTHPYWEFHFDKIPGRWLGRGVIEALNEQQIAINTNTNLRSKAAHWVALRLWQTRDSAGGNRNLLTDVRNGEVLSQESEITRIDTGDRDSAFFTEQDNVWLRSRDEITFSYDVVQGERLPAGTPLGSAQIAISQTLSYFEQVQENVALDIKEMIYEVIIPTFEKESRPEHTLRLVGQDLDQYTEMVKNEKVAIEMARLAIKSLEGSPFPTAEDRDTITLAVEESIKQGKERVLTVPKDFYKGVKYDVDIDITGESVDTRVRAATKFAILQAMTADPTMTTDPIKRKLLAGYAEDGGLNPADFLDTPKASDTMMPQGRAGGGVSAPQLNTAIQGQTSQTV